MSGNNTNVSEQNKPPALSAESRPDVGLSHLALVFSLFLTSPCRCWCWRRCRPSSTSTGASGSCMMGHFFRGAEHGSGGGRDGDKAGAAVGLRRQGRRGGDTVISYPACLGFLFFWDDDSSGSVFRLLLCFRSDFPGMRRGARRHRPPFGRSLASTAQPSTRHAKKSDVPSYATRWERVSTYPQVSRVIDGLHTPK